MVEIQTAHGSTLLFMVETQTAHGSTLSSMVETQMAHGSTHSSDLTFAADAALCYSPLHTDAALLMPTMSHTVCLTSFLLPPSHLCYTVGYGSPFDADFL